MRTVAAVRARIVTVCAVALAAAAMTVAVIGPAGPVGAASRPAPCGGEVVHKSTGGNWTCTFDDEFTESSLVTRYWTAMSTADNAGAQGGQECNTPRNVRLSNGLLVITAQRTAPTPCGRYTTEYTSGMIMTQGKFSQTYGRFEIRAKFPAGKGFQPAFWLLPNDSRATGAYGEIDVVEAYSQDPSRTAPHLHYVQTPGTPGHGVHCDIATNETAFHTYAVEWTPQLMSFIYDGKPCWSTTWKPKFGFAPLLAGAPTPFNQPFYAIIQLAVGGSKTPKNRPTDRTPFPASMYVDYFRVWK